MPKYDKCPRAIADLGLEVLQSDARFTELIESQARICYHFAHADVDDYGRVKGPAIRVHGVAALARAKILAPLDRLRSGFDCDILIDAKHWEDASGDAKRALLAHELWHFMVKVGKRDDNGRPVIKMRDHDYQFGWFNWVAEKYGEYSAEVQQARKLMTESGQFYWPDLVRP